MRRVGDDQAGFLVAADAATGTVRADAWGFWSAEVATVFGRTVIEACRANPNSKTLVLDMKELKPMRDEGQASFGMLIGALASLGIVRARVITASHLTKLQLLRLTTEHGGKDSVEFTTV